LERGYIKIGESENYSSHKPLAQMYEATLRQGDSTVRNLSVPRVMNDPAQGNLVLYSVNRFIYIVFSRTTGQNVF